MSKRTCTPNDSNSPATFEQGPAFPKDGSEIIRALKEAVDQAEFPPGGHLTQKRFSELIGIPKSTINDWFYGRLVDQIKGLLCGLERLNEEQRADLFRVFCRECPRLNDARLKHDPGAVGALMALVQQQAGLTLVTGRSDNARTFLVTAMGNSAGGAVRASGIDVHPPKEFVPVNGVFYLRAGRSAVDLRADVRRLWPTVLNSGARLLIFNCIWRAVPEFQPKILALAKTRNVIVADDIGVGLGTLPRSPGVNVTEVSVQHADKNRSLLDIRIQSAGSH